jgi:hypothetical protein
MIMVDEEMEMEPEKEDFEANGVLRDGWELCSMVNIDILTNKSRMDIPS